jgi:hypothetical protein
MLAWSVRMLAWSGMMLSRVGPNAPRPHTWKTLRSGQMFIYGDSNRAQARGNPGNCRKYGRPKCSSLSRNPSKSSMSFLQRSGQMLPFVGFPNAWSAEMLQILLKRRSRRWSVPQDALVVGPNAHLALKGVSDLFLNGLKLVWSGQMLSGMGAHVVWSGQMLGRHPCQRLSRSGEMLATGRGRNAPFVANLRIMVGRNARSALPELCIKERL